jgi:hypothetical protein
MLVRFNTWLSKMKKRVDSCEIPSAEPGTSRGRGQVYVDSNLRYWFVLSCWTKEVMLVSLAGTPLFLSEVLCKKTTGTCNRDDQRLHVVLPLILICSGRAHQLSQLTCWVIYTETLWPLLDVKSWPQILIKWFVNKPQSWGQNSGLILLS